MALGLKIWLGRYPVGAAPSILPCPGSRIVSSNWSFEPKHEILKLLCLLLNHYESSMKWFWPWEVNSFIKSNFKWIIFVMNQNKLILEKDSNFVKQTHHCAHKKAQNLFPYIYGINHIIFAYIQLFNYWNSSSEKKSKTRGHGLIFLSCFFFE